MPKLSAKEKARRKDMRIKKKISQISYEKELADRLKFVLTKGD
jgi:hypothetical protein